MALTPYTPTYAPKPTGLISQPAYDVATQETTEPQVMTGVTRQVKPEELASTQLDAITASGSPLMQRAASQGKALANQRGLLNSSIAAQSAQNAVIENAAPIAAQNAQAYQQAAGANQEAEQQAAQLNTQQAFQQQATNTAAVNRAQEMAAANKFDLDKMAKAGEIDLNQLRTEYGLRDAQLKLQQQIAAEQTQLGQGNDLQKAYVANSNTLMNNYLNGWFKIQESEMTPEQKTAALGEYNATIRTWTNVLNTAYGSLPAWQNEWGMTFS